MDEGIVLQSERAGPKQRAQRVAAIRHIATQAREDAAERSHVEWLLRQIEPDLPAEAQIFRAYYLDGQTARSIGHRTYMDKRSVHRCNRRVLEAMLPLAFGLDGIYEGVEG